MVKVSVVQKINNLLKEAINKNASDIHFEPYESEFRIRFRVDGVLFNYTTLPYIQKSEFISRIKILADLDIAEKRRPQDGKFNFKIDNKVVDIRVSILPTQFGEKVVLRILDRSKIQLSLDQLGFSNEYLNKYKEVIHFPHGMIIVTGPTGCGKTTTLYSTLNEIYSDEINITTIEDPIEYNLPGINQTHVRADIGYTFSNALRTILRQDPDIIMVGEMRDHETAEIAIRSALTGHLVLSTLHTNDASSTINRLTNMGIESFLISSSVRMIVAQRLVRKICENCKTTYDPDIKVLNKLSLPLNAVYYHGKGCSYCNNTGFLGRTAAFEILVISEKISELIINQRNLTEIKIQAQKEGMKTLLEAAIEKVKTGITTPEEVIFKIISSH